MSYVPAVVLLFLSSYFDYTDLHRLIFKEIKSLSTDYADLHRLILKKEIKSLFTDYTNLNRLYI